MGGEGSPQPAQRASKLIESRNADRPVNRHTSEPNTVREQGCSSRVICMALGSADPEEWLPRGERQARPDEDVTGKETSSLRVRDTSGAFRADRGARLDIGERSNSRRHRARADLGFCIRSRPLLLTHDFERTYIRRLARALRTPIKTRPLGRLCGTF